MKVITAVDEDYSVRTENSTKIFLAGGITNCPDWQSETIGAMEIYSFPKTQGIFSFIKQNITIYNPRRKNFPIDDPNAAEVQIVWEYKHLQGADLVVFWFSRGSLNPIVLYELGRWGNSSDKPIIIGVDEEYERKKDVIMQTGLARPDVVIRSSLSDVINDISYFLDNLKGR